jgi:DnaJ-class molecular chaperone
VDADDYYAILGVNSAASLKRIQAAYRKLAKEYHPDHAGMQGKEKFQAVQEAYEVLSDPGKRKEYDAHVDRRRRIRESRGIIPEPLAPLRRPFRTRHPEPLVRSFSPAEDFSHPRSSPCTFCDGLGNLGFPCPFCRGVAPLERDLEQLLARWVRSFRFGR